MREVWKPITAVQMFARDGRYKYEVSNLGRIRKAGYFGIRNKWYEPHIMVPNTHHKSGAEVITLSESGHSRSFSIHRLVAMTFLDKPDGCDHVVHRDGDKNNNCVSNLMWSDKPECGSRPVGMPGRPVRQYSKELNLIAEYKSGSEAARALGVARSSSLYKCCRREARHKTYAGFVWRYADDDEIAEGKYYEGLLQKA